MQRIIPDCLRICGSMWTQMIIVGDLNSEGYIPLHTDRNDHFNALLSIGETNDQHGSTMYFSGDQKCNEEIICSLPFQHGRLQIGSFSKILHGTQK